MIWCSCSWVCYMLWYSDIWIYSLFWNVGLSEDGHINLFFCVLLIPKCTCPLFYASYTFWMCVSKCYFKLHTAMVNCFIIEYSHIRFLLDNYYIWKCFSSLQWKPCMPVCTWNTWDWILCLLSRVSKVWKYRQKIFHYI